MGPIRSRASDADCYWTLNCQRKVGIEWLIRLPCHALVIRVRQTVVAARRRGLSTRLIRSACLRQKWLPSALRSAKHQQEDRAEGWSARLRVHQNLMTLRFWSDRPVSTSLQILQYLPWHLVQGALARVVLLVGVHRRRQQRHRTKTRRRPPRDVRRQEGRPRARAPWIPLRPRCSRRLRRCARRRMLSNCLQIGRT